MITSKFNRTKSLFVCRAFLILILAAVISIVAPNRTAAQQTSEPAKEKPPAQNAGTSSGDAGSEKTNADATESVPPPFEQLRYEEDYSYLQDESLRRSPLDRLKYIPLREGKPDWYLSIGGEIRQRYEAFRNDDWGAAPPDDNGYLLQRYMLHTDWHFGRRARIFFQLKSGVEAGRTGGPRPPDEDRADVHQAFVDFNFGSPSENAVTGGNGGGANANKFPFTLRAGRQEISLGASRLIGFREGPNVRQSFDGLRAIGNVADWNITGFVFKPVETNPGIFDDGAQTDTTLWGAYATRPLENFLPNGGSLDVYYLGLDRRNASFDQGDAREQRQTIGARVWNRTIDEPAQGKSPEGFDYDVETVYQFGDFGQSRIRAWTVAADFGYTFADARFSPRLSLKANIASGDENPNDRRLGTFNALFPRGAYFNEMQLLGPYNLRAVQPRLDLKFTKSLTFNSQGDFYWRDSLRDGIYDVPGNLARTGQLSNARFIGSAVQINGEYEINRHITISGFYARFFSRRFLEDTPPGRSVNYVSAFVTYKF